MNKYIQTLLLVVILTLVFNIAFKVDYVYKIYTGENEDFETIINEDLDN